MFNNIREYNMKTKVLILALLIMLVFFNLTAREKYIYTYDASGNRIQRCYTEIFERSPAPEIKNQKQIIKKVIGLNEVTVYPNPTTDYLNIKITNFNKDISSRLILMDLTGRIIFKQNKLTEFNNIDLRDYPNGMYLLRIFIDDNSKEWKIIKQE